jgi:hypothetical protein
MDLQAIAQLLGAFGEFIGAIAVVATLGYLAIQIRQNAKGMEASRRHELAKADQDGLLGMAAHAVVIAKMNQEALPQWDSPAEEQEAWFVCKAGFRSWENFAWQYENGFLDAPDYEAMLNDMKAWSRFPFYVDHWRKERHVYSPRLQKYFDPIFQANP